MIPLLKSIVFFDDAGNASVDFEVFKSELQTTEYARFVLLYYAGILYHINPKKRGAYTAYQFLFETTKQIANAKLSKDMDIILLADMADYVKQGAPETKKYKYTGKMFLDSADTRTMKTSVPLRPGWTMQQMACTVPLVISGAFSRCDLADMQIVQLGLEYLNYEYGRNVMLGKSVDCVHVPNTAFAEAINSEEFTIRTNMLFYKCINCSARLKLPRGRGIMKAKCPNCGQEFGIDTF